MLSVECGLKGGKGGYGSLLRSMKPKAKADQNYEACRDLSGRRLRHIYNERRLQEWQQRQTEEAKYIEEENTAYDANRQQLQSAIRANKNKLDERYTNQVEQGANSIVEGVQMS